jgi:GT2 family glycosyltransferase
VSGPAPDVAVVIVSWNTRDLLAECLRVLAAQVAVAGAGPAAAGPGRPAAEVWVVDNASADGSAALVRERFPWVRLLANAENRGFARACNQAARQAGGRHVLFLNPDAEVGPGAVALLVAALDADPGAGAAGPRLVGPDGTARPSWEPFPTLSRELRRLLRPGRAPAAGDGGAADAAPRPVDVAAGACLLVRASALAAAGWLDEAYFMYTEEVDLCRRLRDAGWRVLGVPGARVLHHGAQSTRQAAAAMFRELYASKVRYFRKHHGPGAARAYKAILAAAALARLGALPAALLRPGARRGVWALAGRYARLLGALPRL